jgi:DNA-directed RNA polymerase specialized sigma24 family protein/2'-5' RNA ligase
MPSDWILKAAGKSSLKPITQEEPDDSWIPGRRNEYGRRVTLADTYRDDEKLFGHVGDVLHRGVVREPDGTERPASNFDRLQAASAYVSALDSGRAPSGSNAGPAATLVGKSLKHPVLKGATSTVLAGMAYKAADRVKNGEADSEDWIKIAKFMEIADDEAKKGFVEKVGDILFKMPEFMAGIAATGPLASAAKAGTERLLTRQVKEGAEAVVEGAVEDAVKQTVGQAIQQGVRSAAGTMAGAAARVAAPPTYAMTAENYTRHRAGSMVPILDDQGVEQAAIGGQEGTFEAMTKALGETYIELLSEETGEALTAGAGLGKKLAAGRFPKTAAVLSSFRDRVGQAWVSAVPGRTVGEFLENAASAVKWDGMLAELGEERVADVMGGVFETAYESIEQGRLVPGDFGMVGNAVQGDWDEVKDQALVEGAAFAALPAAGGVARVGGAGAEAIRDFKARQRAANVNKIWKQPGIGSATEAALLGTLPKNVQREYLEKLKAEQETPDFTEIPDEGAADQQPPPTRSRYDGLAIRARQGDREAEGELFASVMEWAKAAKPARTQRDSNDADDYAQDGAMRVFQNFDKWDESKPFEPWAKRVIFNAETSAQRKDASRRGKEGQIPEGYDSDGRPTGMLSTDPMDYINSARERGETLTLADAERLAAEAAKHNEALAGGSGQGTSPPTTRGQGIPSDVDGQTPDGAGNGLADATKQWDMDHRSHRADEWFDGGHVDADAISGWADALNNGGKQLQAHGMSKETTLSGGISNLLNLLENGLDPNRRGGRLDTANLVTEAGEGLVGATASGSAYVDGPLIIVAKPGQALEGDLSGAGAILVNQAHASIAPALQEAVSRIRPDIIVAPYSEAGRVTSQLLGNTKASEQTPGAADSGVAGRLGGSTSAGAFPVGTNDFADVVDWAWNRGIEEADPRALPSRQDVEEAYGQKLGNLEWDAVEQAFFKGADEGKEFDTAAPPTTPDIPRGKPGMMLGAGETVLTKTGRQTTPFPRVDATTDRKTQNTVKRADEWLWRNAVDEARAIGDEFNLHQFEKAADPKRLTQAQKDDMEEYLFGDSEPIKPNGSVLKPIRTPDKDGKGEYTPKDDWRENLMRAREYAFAKGFTREDISGKKLPELVAMIDGKDKPHEYSSTQVNIPDPISQGVLQVGQKIADEDLTEKGRETSPHITVKYGLHTEDVEEVRALLENEPPIRVKLGRTSVFGNEDADVVKIDVESPDLEALNRKIADALPNTETHPDYIPHVTLGYVKPGTGEKYADMQDMAGESMVMQSIVFSGKDGTQVEIPLNGKRRPTAKKPKAGASAVGKIGELDNSGAVGVIVSSDGDKMTLAFEGKDGWNYEEVDAKRVTFDDSWDDAYSEDERQDAVGKYGKSDSDSDYDMIEARVRFRDSLHDRGYADGPDGAKYKIQEDPQNPKKFYVEVTRDGKVTDIGRGEKWSMQGARAKAIEAAGLLPAKDGGKTTDPTRTPPEGYAELPDFTPDIDVIKSPGVQFDDNKREMASLKLKRGDAVGYRVVHTPKQKKGGAKDYWAYGKVQTTTASHAVIEHADGSSKTIGGDFIKRLEPAGKADGEPSGKDVFGRDVKVGDYVKYEANPDRRPVASNIQARVDAVRPGNRFDLTVFNPELGSIEEVGRSVKSAPGERIALIEKTPNTPRDDTDEQDNKPTDVEARILAGHNKTTRQGVERLIEAGLRSAGWFTQKESPLTTARLDALAKAGFLESTMAGSAVTGGKSYRFVENVAKWPGAAEAQKPKARKKTKQQQELDDLANHFAARLQEGANYARITDARKEAEEILGRKVEAGHPDAKLVDEGVERGVVATARNLVEDMRAEGSSDAEIFDALANLYEQQPTLATRDSQQQIDQAYSTPVPLAWLATVMADVQEGDTVYDSTAGNGALLIGATNPVANEKNPDRADGMRTLLGVEVTEADASAFELGKQVDHVIINPPFGEAKDKDDKKIYFKVDGVPTDKIDHAIVLRTMQTMKPDGTAVIIVGSKGHEAGSPKEGMARGKAYLKGKRFWDKLYGKYNVVDHFTISGSLYSKQGASFPIDVIVVSGVGESSRPLPYNFKNGGLPAFYDNLEDLKNDKLKRDVVESGRKPGDGDTSQEGGEDNLGDVGGTSDATGERDGEQDQRSDGRDETGDQQESNEGTGSTEDTPGDSTERDVPGIRDGVEGREEGELPNDSERDDERVPGDDDSGVDGEPLSDIEKAMLEALEQELGGKQDKPKAEKSSKPRGGNNSGNKSGRGGKKATEKAAERKQRTSQEYKDVLEEFKDVFGSEFDSGISPKKVAVTVKLMKAAVNDKISDFAGFVARLAEDVGVENLEKISDYVEAGWRMLKRIDGYGHIDDAGSVAEVLADMANMANDADQDNAPTLFNVDEETEFQSSYKSRSKIGGPGVLVPRSQEEAIQRALQRVEDEHGDLDEFVASELGFDSAKDLEGKLFGVQVDALAMMISNHKKGLAFVLGDQTGVGKGRVAAAMLHYAKRQGLVPVFVTQSSGLYADMVRDLTGIGVNTKQRPFNFLATDALENDKKSELPDGRVITQSLPVATTRLNDLVRSVKAGNGMFVQEGEEVLEFDAIFTTYNQLSPENTKPGFEREPQRVTMLRELAPHAFFVLDESHNAGAIKGRGRGRGEDGEQVHEFSLATITRDLLRSAAASTFLSATFAKRPDLMDIYAQAGMHLAVDDPAQLPGAIKAGGVPLQQVISEMLAEAGGYMRRERSYDGIEFRPEVVDVGLDVADELSSIYNRINLFDKAKGQGIAAVEEDVVSAGGGLLSDDAVGHGAVTSTNFSSLLWNTASQMMVVLKAKRAGEQAVAAWKRGETPLIAVDETMEKALDHYLESTGAQVGDEIDYSFRDVMQRYLDRSRTVKIRRDVSDRTTPAEDHYLTDEELGEEAVALYEEAKEAIEAFAADVPASPIDMMRKVMEDAGMSVLELTGRKKRIHYTSDGRAILQTRPKGEKGQKGKNRTVAAINNGDADALILNRSGATGLSIHNSTDFKNARRRHMILAQTAKNIDEFMQIIGRINRTGQRVADEHGNSLLPIYTYLLSNAPAELRPAAVHVAKMASLNANVTASSDGSVKFDAVDVLNRIGDRLTAEYVFDRPELNDALGDIVRPKRDGSVNVVPGISERITGYMILRPIAEQQEFWDEITASFKTEIEELDRIGKNPLTASTLDLEARKLESFPVFAGDQDNTNPFAQPAELNRVRVKKIGESMKPEDVRKAIEDFYGGDMSTEYQKWGRGQLDRVENLFQEEFRKRSAKMTDPAAINRLRARLDDSETRIQGAILRMGPGMVVEVWRKTQEDGAPTVTTGVVTKLEASTDAKAVRPSGWTMEVALASPDRVLRIPLSRLVDINDAEQGDVTVVPRHRRAQDEDFEEFNAPHESHEERYIASGNLLAAFSTLQDSDPSVIFYTDEHGDKQRGLLMPRSFNANKWANDMPVAFEKPEHVKEFLEQGGILASPDWAIQMTMDESGAVTLRSPRSKTKSRAYTASNRMLDAMGRGFVKRGDIMVSTVPPERVDATIKAVLEIGGLQAGMQKEIARTIVNGGEDNERPAGGRRPPASASSRTPASSASVSGSISRGNNVTQSRSTEAVDSPIDDADALAAADVSKSLQKMFAVPVKSGWFRRNKRADGSGRAGIYSYLYPTRIESPHIARTGEEYYANLAVTVHEIAHGIDQELKVTRKMPTKIAQRIKPLDYDVDRGLATEGWAEFFRMYVSEPDVTINGKKVPFAEDRAPEVYKWFTEKFLPANPRVAKKVAQARELCLNVAHQSAFQRIRNMIAERSPRDVSNQRYWADRLSNSYRRMNSRLVDRFHMAKVLDRMSPRLGMHGQGLEKTMQAYAMTADSNTAVAIRNGVHSLDGRWRGTASLTGLARYFNTDEEYTEAISYAYARHTVFMSSRRPWYNTGLDLEDAQRFMAEMERQGKAGRYTRFAEKLAQYGNDLLAMRMMADSLPEEDRKAIVEYYSDGQSNFYFPLHRVQEEGDRVSTGEFAGAGYVNLSRGIVGRSEHGSNRQIIDPIDAMIAKTYSDYGHAAKTRVIMTLLEQCDPRFGGNGNLGGLLNRVTPKTVITSGSIGEILKQLVDNGVVSADNARAMKLAWKFKNGENVNSDDTKWFAKRHFVDPTDMKALIRAAKKEPDVTAMIQIYRPNYSPDAKSLVVRINGPNGKPLLYQCDRLVYDLLTQMDSPQVAFMGRMFRFATSGAFKLGAVTLNPAFAIKNVFYDYPTAISRAENQTVYESITGPAARLVGYAAYKAGHKSEMDALYNLYDELGGSAFSRVGPDMAHRKRTRRRLMSKSWQGRWGLKVENGKGGKLEVLGHMKDAAVASLDRAADIMAISDAPPRLAEMLAAARKENWEPAADNWKNTETGEIAPSPPEWVRVKMANAAAEASLNFKRFGSWYYVTETILPLSNAATQAAVRFTKEMAAMGNVANFRRDMDGNLEMDGVMARKRAMVIAAMITAEVVYWLIRGDDDDYKNQEDWLKDGYYTFGWDNKTVFTVPKAREYAVFGNMVRSWLESGSDEDVSTVRETLKRDLLNRIPSGGGLLPGVLDVLRDKDSFKDRELTPGYIADKPPEIQYTDMTSATSKLIGRFTGRWLNLSPIQVEHLLNSASGGQYAWATRAWDNLQNGRPEIRDIPGARAFYLNQEQGRAVQRFYEEWKEVKDRVALANEAGKPNERDEQRLSELRGYAEMMTAFRNMEGDRRTYDNEPIIVGLARDAMGLPEQVSTPNPLSDGSDEMKAAIRGAFSKSPPDVETPQQEVARFVAARVKRVMLGDDMPATVHEGDENFDETLTKWQDARKRERAWIEERAELPVIQSSLEAARRTDTYLDIRMMRGSYSMPKFGTKNFQNNLKRWKARIAAARSF